MLVLLKRNSTHNQHKIKKQNGPEYRQVKNVKEGQHKAQKGPEEELLPKFKLSKFSNNRFGLRRFIQ